MEALSSTEAAAMAAGTSADAETCVYCANLKALRDLLPPKRCDYCRKWRCQFCTLKFPLLGARKGLPKAMKGNTRICVQCFGSLWQEEQEAASSGRPRRSSVFSKHTSLPEIHEFRSESHRGRLEGHESMATDIRRRESMMVDRVWEGKESFSDSRRLSFMNSSDENDITKRPVVSSSGTEANSIGAAHPLHGLSYRMASFLGLVVCDDATGISMISAIDLWMSLFAASILLVIALADGFSLQQRVCYCVATYGLFLTLHPWIHADRLAAEPTKGSETQLADNTAANQASTALPGTKRTVQKSVTVVDSSVPAAYRTKIQEMDETLAYYLSDKCPWKLVKTTSGGEVYEMTANKTPFAIFKIETFITGISVADFLKFVDSKDPRDRSVWDLNVANFEVIETLGRAGVSEDAPQVSVCVNSQKPFLGGLVAPRDFCLLYVARANSICFSSIEHPQVPVRRGSTRGNVFFSCFHFQEDSSVDGPSGFAFKYICQTDIGGSLPPKLLYNGTMDNMEKMTKVFQQAGRVFPK